MKTLAPKISLGLLAVLIILSGKSLKAQINNFDFSNEDNLTAVSSLMNAVIDGDEEGVKFFVKAGSDVTNKKNIGGATALHLAARSGNADIAKILVENGANVNVTDNENWTPLMRAATAANPAIIEMLIDKGADAEKFNIMHETVIIHAADSECLECLNILFAKYDFSKMDRQNLKDQINEALTISKNKDNNSIQAVLSDAAVKYSQAAQNNLILDGSGAMITKDLDGKNNISANKRYRFVGEVKNKAKSEKSKNNKIENKVENNKMNFDVAKQPEIITEVITETSTETLKSSTAGVVKEKNIQKKKYILKKTDEANKNKALPENNSLENKKLDKDISEIKIQDISKSQDVLEVKKEGVIKYRLGTIADKQTAVPPASAINKPAADKITADPSSSDNIVPTQQ